MLKSEGTKIESHYHAIIEYWSAQNLLINIR